MHNPFRVDVAYQIPSIFVFPNRDQNQLLNAFENLLTYVLGIDNMTVGYPMYVYDELLSRHLTMKYLAYGLIDAVGLVDKREDLFNAIPFTVRSRIVDDVIHYPPPVALKNFMGGERKYLSLKNIGLMPNDSLYIYTVNYMLECIRVPYLKPKVLKELI